MLFSDIRGFTEVAERLEPERLVALLNTYLTPMTRAVLARGGYLDKYIGDAVMAVYGAPVRCEDHVARALSTAVDMHRALVGLSGQLEETLSMGIGINTGEVVVGNMGATERFDYTAIGDAVNLASRLEGLTRVYDVQCLVGAETRAAAPASYQFREIDLVRVKGKERPVAVHELLAGPEGQIVEYAALDRFAAGLAAYRAGELAAARAAFAAFAEKNPADAVAKLYLERLAALGDAAPAGWDGVFSFTRK